MSLRDIWNQYADYTKAASDSARQLALAGIAVVWLFKVDAGASVHLDRGPLWAGIAFVLSLACDLLQSVTGTIVFLSLGNLRERGPKSEQNADYPEHILRPIDLFFWAKIILVLAGYGLLVGYFCEKLA